MLTYCNQMETISYKLTTFERSSNNNEDVSTVFKLQLDHATAKEQKLHYYDILSSSMKQPLSHVAQCKMNILSILIMI